jgi:hypothetical protein
MYLESILNFNREVLFKFNYRPEQPIASRRFVSPPPFRLYVHLLSCRIKIQFIEFLCENSHPPFA